MFKCVEKSPFQHVDSTVDNLEKEPKNAIVDICIIVLVNIMTIMRSSYILAFYRWKWLKEKRASSAPSSNLIIRLI